MNLIHEENIIYNEWVEENSEDIIERYIESFLDFPEHIYEGVLDDDAESTYLENLTLDNIPEDYIRSLYELGL